MRASYTKCFYLSSLGFYLIQMLTLSVARLNSYATNTAMGILCKLSNKIIIYNNDGN